MESDLSFTKPFPCLQCGRAFALDTCLAAHKTIEHQEEPPHKCSVCSIAFFSAIAYNYHILKHSLQRESPTSYYKCSECSLDFPSEHGLRVHLSTHTGLSIQSRGRKIPWKKVCTFVCCRFCPAIISGRRRYEDHLKTHKLVKFYECEQCHMTFRLDSQLQLHRKRHTEEKESQSKVEEKTVHETVSDQTVIIVDKQPDSS